MPGTLIVSLDFELFWGMHDSVTLDEYKDRIAGGKRAIPQMLHVFSKYGIHATWATVGMMFANNAKEATEYFPGIEQLPTYKDSNLSSYQCFDELTRDEDNNVYLFAPDELNLIANTEGQEIGSHTFSHYYCRENGQTIDQFEADIVAAKNIAADQGYHLESFVFPKNQSTEEATEVLRKHGFKAFRHEESDWIHERIRIKPLLRVLRLMDVYIPLTGHGGYIPKSENGIVDLPGSRMFKPYFKPLFFLEGLKIRRIKRQMLYAAKHGLTFHLWWHPHNVGSRTEYHMQRLEDIFSYYSYLKDKYGMRSANMGETAREILEK